VNQSQIDQRHDQPQSQRLAKGLGRVLPLGVLALLAGCQLAPPKECAVHPLGVVRAEQRDDAERFGDLVATLQPEIKALLPDTPDRSTEVWVQKQLASRRGQRVPLNVKGFTLISEDHSRGRIHLREDVDHPEWFLAHELVHALLGETWKTLPAVLEEGLADVVAAELRPELAPRIRALRAIEASLYLGRLKLVISHSGIGYRAGNGPLEIWFHYDEPRDTLAIQDALTPDTYAFRERFGDMDDALYGVGFLIVQRLRDRIGYEGLHELCLRAASEGREAIDPAEQLRLAGLDQRNGLLEAAYGALGRPEFDAWVELLPHFHAELLTELFAPTYGHLSAEQFSAQVNPALELGDGSSVHPLRHPRVWAEFLLRWPGPTAGESSRATP
jgi:hypothetical protein